MSKMIFAFCAVSVVILGVYSSALARSQAQTRNCNFWRSKIDEATIESQEEQPGPLDDRSVLKGIRCLLQMEPNLHLARFSGAVNPSVSQLFPPATANVAALYYVSFLFTGRWDHADAVALRGVNGEVNSPEIITRAYKSYRRWFAEIRKLGLERARREKRDPLRNSGVTWY
jgi:hypothetical protein